MLRIGILIAGSLYWSDRAHRKNWRQQHLKAGSEICVSVPIRYGRLSSTRTYTMVFAPGCQSGEAKILVSALRQQPRAMTLFAKPRHYGLPRIPDGSPRKRTETLASDWGCVAFLANPKSVLPATIFKDWADRVTQEHHHKSLARSSRKRFLRRERNIRDHRCGYSVNRMAGPFRYHKKLSHLWICSWQPRQSRRRLQVLRIIRRRRS